jgi:hypothetical protein
MSKCKYKKAGFYTIVKDITYCVNMNNKWITISETEYKLYERKIKMERLELI